MKRSKRAAAKLVLVCLLLALTGCEVTERNAEAEETKSADVLDNIEKGYHLPIESIEKDEAEHDLLSFFERLAPVYREYEMNNGSETDVPEAILEEQASFLANEGYVVRTNGIYANLCNESEMDRFLLESKKGISGEIVLFTLGNHGTIVRNKYFFDGKKMYDLATSVTWMDDKCIWNDCTQTRLKTWRYSEKGWFCYELCVPEYPEVTEVVDGSVLIRVKPLSKENRESSERYVLGIGYQGNNLLCSNWSVESLDQLDYAGLFEYLYALDSGKRFASSEATSGIAAEEFEQIITHYIPITKEQLREVASFDEENQIYLWAKFGCMNYAPNYFGTSYPMVADRRDNGDGTITLTVEAVCEMMLNNEAVITHELTIRDKEDGSFQYLGNHILNDGMEQIPAYQFRVETKK